MLLLMIFGGTGLVIAGLGVPLVMRRVPPNDLYGLRTPATRKNETLWYEANARSGWYSVLTGVAVAGTALALHLAGVPREVAGAVDILVLLLAVSILCVKSSRMAAKLDRPDQ
jgi:uncharacterized membrane protein